MKKIYHYDENNNIATTKIIDKILCGIDKYGQKQYKYQTFIGKAKMHLEDKIIKSKFTGLTISTSKAIEKRYKAKIKAEKQYIDYLKKELILHFNNLEQFQFTLSKEVENRELFIANKEKLKNAIYKKKEFDNLIEENRKFLTELQEKLDKERDDKNDEN